MKAAVELSDTRVGSSIDITGQNFWEEYDKRYSTEASTRRKSGIANTGNANTRSSRIDGFHVVLRVIGDRLVAGVAVRLAVLGLGAAHRLWAQAPAAGPAAAESHGRHRCKLRRCRSPPSFPDAWRLPHRRRATAGQRHHSEAAVHRGRRRQGRTAALPDRSGALPGQLTTAPSRRMLPPGHSRSATSRWSKRMQSASRTTTMPWPRTCRRRRRWRRHASI